VAEVEESCNGDICSWDAINNEPSATQFEQPSQQQSPIMHLLPAPSPRPADAGQTMPMCEDWALIHEVMMLTQQKEAEVFATLLACREERVAALRQNCQQAQGEIRKLMRPGLDVCPKVAADGNTRSATFENATKGRGVLTSCRPPMQTGLSGGGGEALCCPAQLREDGHVLHTLDEVSFLATPSSPSTARLETASGSQSLDTHTQTTTPYWLTPRPPQLVHEQVEQESKLAMMIGTCETAAEDEPT